MQLDVTTYITVDYDATVSDCEVMDVVERCGGGYETCTGGVLEPGQRMLRDPNR